MGKEKKDGKNGIDRWSGGGVSIVNFKPPKKSAAKEVKKSGRKR